MVTNWKREFERMGFSMTRLQATPAERARRQTASPLDPYAPDWVANYRGMDDSIVAPKAKHLEPLLDSQLNKLGVIRDLLYNAGVTHVVTYGESETAISSRIEDEKYPEAGRYSHPHKLSISENTSATTLRETIPHEAAHALSYEVLSRTGHRLSEHPDIVAAYEKDLALIKANGWVQKDGQSYTTLNKHSAGNFFANWFNPGLRTAGHYIPASMGGEFNNPKTSREEAFAQLMAEMSNGGKNGNASLSAYMPNTAAIARQMMADLNQGSGHTPSAQRYANGHYDNQPTHGLHVTMADSGTKLRRG